MLPGERVAYKGSRSLAVLLIPSSEFPAKRSLAFLEGHGERDGKIENERSKEQVCVCICNMSSSKTLAQSARKMTRLRQSESI